MTDLPRILCVIPARGGSKSIPLKNLRKLSGLPLVAWPINSAINSGIINKVVCSSDHDGILEVAKKFGSEIHKRPSILSTDEAESPPVVLDVIEVYEKQGFYFDYVFMLEPTSPLTEPDDLFRAFNLLQSNIDSFESLVTVSESISAHPDFTFELKNNNKLESVNQEAWKVKRRQDISKLYFIEGTLYLSTIESFKRNLAFVHNKTMGMIVPRAKSLEIDEELDFYLVEGVLKYRNEKNG